MEHRCTIRSSHACDIFVDSPPDEPKRMRSCNIGAGGIFVEAIDFPFALNAVVTATFRLHHGNQAADFCLRAMVVRVAPAGAAIMFLDTDAEALRRLDKLLRKMQRAAARVHPAIDLDSQIDRSVGKIANA